KEKQGRGYYGIILLNPDEEGITEYVLVNDIRQNLYAAARKYRDLKSRSSLPEEAVALFFGSQNDLESAVGFANSEYYRCYSDHGGACESLRNHRAFQKDKKEFEEAIAKETDPGKKEQLQWEYDDWLRYRRSHGGTGIRPEDLQWYEEFEKRTRWFNNLDDDYTRDAVKLFFGYVNHGYTNR
ncbi:MAG: hypothetical protein KJ574_03560, partial [Nanoarchaeota archaeon]|nr:hypothetical protein [Nanoarchaeota archaeon]